MAKKSLSTLFFRLPRAMCCHLSMKIKWMRLIIFQQDEYTVSFTKSNFTNFSYNENTGALYIVSRSIIFDQVIFADNTVMNIETTSNLIQVVSPFDDTPNEFTVKSSSFMRNVAYSASLFNLKNFSILFNMTKSQVVDNCGHQQQRFMWSRQDHPRSISQKLCFNCLLIWMLHVRTMRSFNQRIHLIQ